MCDQNPVFIAGPANTPDRFRRAIAALGLKLVVNEPHLASIRLVAFMVLTAVMAINWLRMRHRLMACLLG